MTVESNNNKPESILFLSDVMNAKFLLNGKKIGELLET